MDSVYFDSERAVISVGLSGVYAGFLANGGDNEGNKPSATVYTRRNIVSDNIQSCNSLNTSLLRLF